MLTRQGGGSCLCCRPPNPVCNNGRPVCVQGLQGPPGATGATGAAGPAGAPGSTGATGATGAGGPQGVRGPTGATGARGVAGPQGFAGATVPFAVGAFYQGGVSVPLDQFGVIPFTGTMVLAQGMTLDEFGGVTVSAGGVYVLQWALFVNSVVPGAVSAVDFAVAKTPGNGGAVEFLAGSQTTIQTPGEGAPYWGTGVVTFTADPGDNFALVFVSPLGCTIEVGSANANTGFSQLALLQIDL